MKAKHNRILIWKIFSLKYLFFFAFSVVPETRLVGIPTTDVEELIDSIAIRCIVSSNPKAAVVWKKEGQTQPASLQELLQFSPAVRQHAGLYTCHARNKAGESQPVRVNIDVKCKYAKYLIFFYSKKILYNLKYRKT